MNTRSRGVDAADQGTSEDPHNSRSSILPLEAPHNARKSTGAIANGTKGLLASKTGTTAASDSVAQIETGRKVTPEKITKWFVDTASAVVDKIPTIKPRGSQMGSVGTTD